MVAIRKLTSTVGTGSGTITYRWESAGLCSLLGILSDGATTAKFYNAPWFNSYYTIQKNYHINLKWRVS
jgi:hypothetical protein